MHITISDTKANAPVLKNVFEVKLDCYFGDDDGDATVVLHAADHQIKQLMT